MPTAAETLITSIVRKAVLDCISRQPKDAKQTRRPPWNDAYARFKAIEQEF